MNLLYLTLLIPGLFNLLPFYSVKHQAFNTNILILDTTISHLLKMNSNLLGNNKINISQIIAIYLLRA